MGTIAEKLSYLADTKDLFKDRLNSLGAEITSSTTFRNYLNWLDTFYGEVSDKTDLSVNGMVGRTSQESTTGKNLNIFPYGTGGNGNGITFTINNDGTVVLNGKNNGNGNSARLFYNNVENPMVLEAGRYYMIPPNNTNIVYVMTDGTNYYSFNNNNGYSQLFNSNLSVKQFYVQVAKNNTTTFTNEKIYPMLATTQVTQSDWEQYTGGQPSPNPDYPQPINNLSGNVSYKIEGKNIFNVTDLTTITISDNGRATNTTTSDKIIATTGTPSSNSGVYIRNIGQYVDNYDSSKTYNVSFDIKASQPLNFKYGQDGYTIIETTIDTTLTRLSVSTLFRSSGFVFYSTQNRADDTIEISNIMISESEDTTYEKYTGIRTFTIPLGDIELCKIDTYADKIYSNNGRFYLYKEIYKNKMLSSYNWYTSNNTNFKFITGSLRPGIINEKCYCNLYTQATIGDVFAGRVDYGVAMAVDKGIAFRNKDIPYNLNAWKTYLDNNDVILYYGLATPTTTEITQENYPSLYNVLKQIQDYLTAYKINKEFILGYSSPEIEY